MIIGITGKSGSGKTTIANIIKDEFAGNVIHVDDIAHDVLTFKVYKSFLESYGYEVLESDVDRKRLGRLIFSDTDMLDNYNAYMYELIKPKLDEITQDKNQLYILDWNFLPITPLFNECDIKILMKCDDEMRKERVKVRDNISDEYFEARDARGIEYNDEDYDIVMENTNLIAKKDEIRKIIGGRIWN